MKSFRQKNNLELKFAALFLTGWAIRVVYWFNPEMAYLEWLADALTFCSAWPLVDLIKTKMQASLSSNKSFMEFFREISKDGIKHFYKGFHFALYRAVALHSSTFFMYDYITNKRTINNI